MAGSVNKVILIGYLGKDPEIRRKNNNDLIVNLTLATSEQWRDKSTGERKERTEWHRVVIFNDTLAHIAEQYLRKGSQVYLEGQLQTRKWTDQQSVERYSTEVVLQRFGGQLTLLGKSGSGGPPPADSPNDYGRTSTRGAGASGRSMEPAGGQFDLDDEIPF